MTTTVYTITIQVYEQKKDQLIFHRVQFMAVYCEFILIYASHLVFSDIFLEAISIVFTWSKIHLENQFV